MSKSIASSVAALSAIAHEGRMSVFRLLARRAPDTVAAGDLVEALDLNPSTLSVYVKILMQAGLIRQERSGRSLRYGIAFEEVGDLVEFLVVDCCHRRPELTEPVCAERRLNAPGSETRPFNVLFVCTGNSTRSIFAEAILSRIAAGRFTGYSAGTKPYATINPLAETLLRSKGYDTTNLRPQDFDDFLAPSAPKMDFVFTVCDMAANEECPPLPGQPVSAHWGMVDPVGIEGSEAVRALAFQEAYGMLERRLDAFVSLPLDSLNRLSLQHELDQIGRGDAPLVSV